MNAATPDSVPEMEHLITDDASLHEQAQSWLPVEYSQIDAGEFKGSVTRRELGPVTTFLEYQNKAVHKRAEVPVNRCTVSMVDHGHGAARFMRHAMDQDDLLFLMPGSTDCDLVIPADVSTCYAVMDEDELLAGIRTLGAEGWENGIAGLQVYQSNSGRQLLAQLSDVAFQCDANVPSQAEELGQMLVHQLALIVHQATVADATADIGQLLRQRRLEVVRKTRDYILACLEFHISPTIVDICHNVGVSGRVLQYSFNEYLQITPVAYLRILRLNKVRQQLLAPGTPAVTVTELATRFGFMHLSNFARDYNALFGERPSATLQRAMR